MTTPASSPRERVLVTGATGFVGQHVVAALLDAGHRVVALCRRGSLPPALAGRCDAVLHGDVCDAAVQRDALRDVQAVCHLAAHIPARYDGLDEIERCFAVNARAAIELATCAADLGVRRFLHFSTGNMYLPGAGARVETDRIFPADCASDYMVSKLAAEIFLANLARRRPLELVVFRLGTPYGPGEPSHKVIPTFLRRAEQGQPLRLAGGGNAAFNFVDVRDVAELAAQAVAAPAQGFFNVGSGEHTTLLELARTVAALPGIGAALEIEPAAAGAFGGFPAIAIDKARATFGFAPRPLAAGLRDYRDFLRRTAP